MIIEFKESNTCSYKDLEKGDLFAFYAEYLNDKDTCDVYIKAGDNDFAINLETGSASDEYSLSAKVIKLKGKLLVEEL